jgi:hypothetical protein
MNKCALGGHLVDGATALPTDPVDHDDEALPILGCQRLRCAQCGKDVGSTTEGGDRLYKCACRQAPIPRGNGLALDEPDADRPQNLPWACAGHPLAELPHDFDGVTVTADGIEALVLRSLGGWLPPGARAEDRARAYWVGRLYVRLQGTPHAAKIPAVCAAAMDHADVATRSRALQFFLSFPLPVGGERALALLGGDRALYAGVRDAVTEVREDGTLEETLWRLAGPLVPTNTRARDLARADALTPGKGSSAVYWYLTSDDAAWVAEHAEEIARATPARVKDLIKLCKYRFPKSVPQKPVVERLQRLGLG